MTAGLTVKVSLTAILSGVILAMIAYALITLVPVVGQAAAGYEWWVYLAAGVVGAISGGFAGYFWMNKRGLSYSGDGGESVAGSVEW